MSAEQWHDCEEPVNRQAALIMLAVEMNGAASQPAARAHAAQGGVISSQLMRRVSKAIS